MTKLPDKKKRKTRTRGNGNGTVYQLPSGRWRWQLRAGSKLLAQGICDKRRQADDELAEARTQFLRGTLTTPDSTKLSEFATTWLERQDHLAPGTRTKYTYELKYVHDSSLGKMKLRDVRSSDVKSLLHNLSKRIMTSGLGKDKPMATSTLTNVRGRLLSVFKEAMSDQLIHMNPMNSVRRIKAAYTSSESDTGGVALDFHEAARLYELGEALYAAGSCRLWPAIFTALSVGLRRGEVMGLRWQDVDLERGVLMVRKNLTIYEGQLLLGKPKTALSVRDIPMPSSLKATLTAHREAMIVESTAIGQVLTGETPVFATTVGTFTHPDNLGKILSHVIEWSNPAPLERKVRLRGRNGAMPGDRKLKTLDQRMKAIPREHRAKLKAIIYAGTPLPMISPHDLRHTAATLMLRRGMPIEVVSRILGHASISITYNKYRHVLESEKRAMMVDLFPDPLPPRDMDTPPLN